MKVIWKFDLPPFIIVQHRDHGLCKKVSAFIYTKLLFELKFAGKFDVSYRVVPQARWM